MKISDPLPLSAVFVSLNLCLSPNGFKNKSGYSVSYKDIMASNSFSDPRLLVARYRTILYTEFLKTNCSLAFDYCAADGKSKSLFDFQEIDTNAMYPTIKLVNSLLERYSLTGIHPPHQPPSVHFGGGRDTHCKFLETIESPTMWFCTGFGLVAEEFVAIRDFMFLYKFSLDVGVCENVQQFPATWQFLHVTPIWGFDSEVQHGTAVYIQTNTYTPHQV